MYYHEASEYAKIGIALGWNATVAYFEFKFGAWLTVVGHPGWGTFVNIVGGLTTAYATFQAGYLAVHGVAKVIDIVELLIVDKQVSERTRKSIVADIQRGYFMTEKELLANKEKAEFVANL